MTKRMSSSKDVANFNYRRIFFGQTVNKSHTNTMSEDLQHLSADEYLELGDDYFAYALCAFFIFDEEELEIVKTENNSRKSILKPETLYDQQSENEETTSEMDKLYLNYERRMRNRQIFFRALFMWTIEMLMVVYII